MRLVVFSRSRYAGERAAQHRGDGADEAFRFYRVLVLRIAEVISEDTIAVIAPYELGDERRLARAGLGVDHEAARAGLQPAVQLAADQPLPPDEVVACRHFFRKSQLVLR